MSDFDSPEFVRKVKIRDSFAGDAIKDHFGARISEGGTIITTPTKDSFLLCASHNVQAPHNYNPVHEHNTRYREWYSSHFAVVTEEYRKPKKRRSASPGSSDDGQKCLLLLAFLVLLLAILLGYILAFRTAQSGGSGLLSRDDVNETAVVELRSLLASLDEEQNKTKHQLEYLSERMHEDVVSAQIHSLREELSSLAKRFHGALEQQDHLFASHSALSDELQALHKQSDTAKPLAPDSGEGSLQQQLAQIKDEVKALSAGLKDTQEQTKRAEEKTLSVDGVSKEVKAAVAQSVAGLLKNHSLLQECAASEEGCAPTFKSSVVEEVRKMAFAELAESSGDLVEKYVQKSIWEAVAGYDGEGGKSELEGSIKGVLKAVYEENLGGVDWMLSINGAEIVDNSPSYDPCKGEDGFKGAWCRSMGWNPLFGGKPLQLLPETIIKTETNQGANMGEQWTQLGNCWAMNGTTGFVDVRLDMQVEPYMFVVEHAPARLSYQGGTSAPRSFSVQGWVSGDLQEQWRTLVRGEYDISKQGFNAHIQSFPIPTTKDHQVVDRIRVQVESNHGNPTFTCLYHLRLYGKLPPLPVLHKSAK